MASRTLFSLGRYIPMLTVMALVTLTLLIYGLRVRSKAISLLGGALLLCAALAVAALALSGNTVMRA